ncbi:hypothetical protein CAPN001_24510 [Capnocytophaga stomatis]|nr:hypothetical protein CAPN001_24510 [Capnocytophaga stomatis]
MKKISLYFIVVLLFCFVNCSTNRKIEIKQKYSFEDSVDITFFKKKGVISDGTIIIKNSIVLKNPSLNFFEINFHYFRKGDTISLPNQATLKTMTDEKYFKKTGKRNRIKLNPLEERKIDYFVWNDIDSLDFTNKYYKSLEQYKDLVKPTDMSSVMPDSPNPVDKNILSYEEPFSEFKRKNPELLEFLTKGDSIELEVISPVKQKYKFKAEW